MILQVKKNTITRGEGASSSRVCLMARGNESSSSSESESDDDMLSYEVIV